MHWSQIVIGALLLVACWFGRRDKLLVTVMLANFIATITLEPTPSSVAAADLACATVLFFGSTRAMFVAAVFIVMAAFYPLANALGLSNAATYTIVDLLALVQFFVVGGGDRGIRSIRRHLDRLRASFGRSLVHGSPSPDPDMVARQDRGESR